MAESSVLAAVMAKYGTLSAAGFPGSEVPSIWLDEAPQEGSTGSQLKPPYVIIRDGGGRDEWDFETNAITPGSFSLDVYYADDGTSSGVTLCDQAMAAIFWNNVAPNLRSGIAFMTCDLVAPLYGMDGAVIPTTDQHSYAGLNFQGKRVYKYTHDFDVTYQTRGTG